MKKTLTIFLILIFCSTPWSNLKYPYLIISTDRTKIRCDILENDTPSKRLEIQRENNIRKQWLSYHQIDAIIEIGSQKDVTSEFISLENRMLREETKRDIESNIMIVAILVLIGFFGLAALGSD